MSGKPRQNAIYLFELMPIGGFSDYPMHKANSVRVQAHLFGQRYGAQFTTKILSQGGEKFLRLWRRR
jgi:hypothetical protein